MILSSTVYNFDVLTLINNGVTILSMDLINYSLRFISTHKKQRDTFINSKWCNVILLGRFYKLDVVMLTYNGVIILLMTPIILSPFHLHT